MDQPERAGESVPRETESISRRWESFLRWYFVGRQKHPILSLLAKLAVTSAVVIFWVIALRRPGNARLAAFLRDPFFILSWVFLICSNAVNSYMEFCLGKRGIVVESGVREQKYIADAYERAYGEDLWIRLWRWRFASIACLFIALIRFLWSAFQVLVLR